MFIVKNVNLNSKTDLVINKLTGCIQFDVPLIFKIVKFKKEYDRVMSIVNDTQKKIIEKYCDKDEKGNPKVNNGNYTFTNSVTEFSNDMSEFIKQESEFNIDKLCIKLKDVPKELFSAQDLIILENFIDFSE